MRKSVLSVSIVLTGILLGIVHYKLKPTPEDKQLQEYAQSMTSSTEWRGRIAPDFEAKTTRGERFQLSENIGKKVIVLNFFATWCVPCREEMPELNRYFSEHKADSFLLVGVALRVPKAFQRLSSPAVRPQHAKHKRRQVAYPIPFF